MKTIQVNERAFKVIEGLRNDNIGSFEGEMENFLDTLSGLNDIICVGRDSEEVAQHADAAQRAQDIILQYYHFLQNLRYENDVMELGKVNVTQMADD